MKCTVYIALIFTFCNFYELADSKQPNLGIIGGQEAVPHSAPYMVRLKSFTYDIRTKELIYVRCGGTVITNEHVLTARHCVKGIYGTDLYFGKHNVSKHEDGEIKMTSQQYIINQDADVAIIKLPQRLNFSANIQKVTLVANKDSKKSYEGETGTAFGWGLINDDGDRPVCLMKVNVGVISNDECSRELNRAVKYNEMCTSGVGTKGTCLEDSGGPFMINNTQVGITAYGPAFCELDGPSAYIRVGHFLDWIAEKTRIITY